VSDAICAVFFTARDAAFPARAIQPSDPPPPSGFRS
jgi:hypothetical protein